MTTESIKLHKKNSKEEKNQPIIIDFYNLHLKSGPKYDKYQIPEGKFLFPRNDEDIPIYEDLKELKIEPIYPDKEEQNRILYFFEKYAPDLKTANGGMEYYQSIESASWFESKYFLRFADDYHYIKQIVDEYINNKISTINLKWLESKLYGVRPVLKLFSRRDGKEFMIMREVIVNSTEYQIEYLWSRTIIQKNGIPYYGIDLDILFRTFNEIFFQAAIMQIEKWAIKRCSFEGGKRNPRCNNVFISTRGQKYCSKKCYDRARRSRGYLKEQQKP